jgi:hypothetical protein
MEKNKFKVVITDCDHGSIEEEKGNSVESAQS